jgi:hypothetical protein
LAGSHLVVNIPPKFHRYFTNIPPFATSGRLALHRGDWYFTAMSKARRKTMKTPSQTRATTETLVTIDAPLSPHWAFVVQFRALPGGSVFEAGRVEHLASGRTSRFQSLEELQACFSKELGMVESAVKR